MRELGYVDGRNLTIEWRFAEGDYERLPGMAAELDPVEAGLVKSLAQPGGNITGSPTSGST